MRLGLLLVIACAGCVRPSLNTCEDWACPAQLQCTVLRGTPTCVTEAQLADCASRFEGEPCPSGICFDGVCQSIECGNGHREGDEVCDDGNTLGGDGCSSGCTMEICGNGITDPNEGCDCGDPGVEPRPECRGSNNSSDAAAPCREDCTLRSCGDGKLEAPEQCEGTLLGSLTCTTFGFYAGALGCTPFCTVDTAGCSGRCGDGIRQAPQEQCDGAQLGTARCMDFNYYFGSLGCSPFCSYTTTGCTGRCGDGVYNQNLEQCDGTHFGGATCSTYYTTFSGQLTCTNFCLTDVYSCHGCGDLQCEVDRGETCANCPQDCMIGSECCGDGTCALVEAQERTSGRCNCFADCQSQCP